MTGKMFSVVIPILPFCTAIVLLSFLCLCLHLLQQPCQSSPSAALTRCAAIARFVEGEGTSTHYLSRNARACACASVHRFSFFAFTSSPILCNSLIGSRIEVKVSPFFLHLRFLLERELVLRPIVSEAAGEGIKRCSCSPQNIDK